MGRISLATRLCEMPTMIRPKRTFAANNATATTQNARSLSGSSLGDRYKKSPATVVVGLLRLERTTGRLRIRFADPHRLRPPAGDLASSLQTLRVCLTLAPSRVRAQAMDTKKPGYRSSRAVTFGADNGARTRDPNLGKVVLYQLSHVRICKTKRAPERPDVAWRRSPDSNRG